MITDGSMDEIVLFILEDIKPEAVYFTTVEGTRGGFIVINVDAASQITAMTELPFLGLGTGLCRCNP